MDVHFEDFRANQHTVEVGEDDTVEGLRRKVASAMGLPEDSFCMSFDGEAMGEGYDMTQLSAGETIILTKTKTKKYEAIAELHALGETNITAERLESVRDPEVACLLLQAEVATVIPYHFLRETSLTHLDLGAVSFVTQIEESFLEECTSLTSIDLSGLSNVTVIGRNFLYKCNSLTTLDLTPLGNVTRIDNYFLSGCNSLTSLDLTPLHNVTRIGTFFISYCNSLTTLDLTPLGNVTEFGFFFLAGCSSLTTVDLTPLHNVTKISDSFLQRCTSLTTLDLTPLHNVTSICSNFLLCCSLTTLDLSPLNKVKYVGSGFAGNCTSLTSIYLSGCSSAVSNKVRKSEHLRQFVVEARPKRSRDESPEQSQKRQRHAQ